jgi:hypothetical protein
MPLLRSLEGVRLGRAFLDMPLLAELKKDAGGHCYRHAALLAEL